MLFLYVNHLQTLQKSPWPGPECPSHVIYLRSDVPLFVARCFSEPLDFWEKEPHTHRSLFFQCKCFAAPVHNTIYWKACSRRFLLVDFSQSLSHEREVSNNFFFFNGSQNLPCLFARNSQKNQEFVIFVLLPCQQCCPGNWSKKTDLILFKFSVLFDSEEVQEGNIWNKQCGAEQSQSGFFFFWFGQFNQRSNASCGWPGLMHKANGAERKQYARCCKKT